MILETSSVVLRRPEPEDVERLYQFRNDWEIAGGLGGFTMGMSRKDVSEWIEFHRSKRDETIWVIADKKDSTCIGTVGLYQIDHRIQIAEYGISIGDKTWWGKGVGKEVAVVVLRFAFEELNLHQIRIYMLETNQRTIALHEKLGFRLDGRLRCNQFREGRFVDTVIMSILRHEWSQRGSSQESPMQLD